MKTDYYEEIMKQAGLNRTATPSNAKSSPNLGKVETLNKLSEVVAAGASCGSSNFGCINV